jgi:DGQHR domain-containing protein
MSTSQIIFPCLQLEQPIGVFYVGVISSRDLVEISFADRRRIERGERDIEIISGIQRPLAPTRVKELRKYVHNVDASFPSAVILAVDAEHASYDDLSRTMTITRDSNVARIIDGQHRIEGLVGYDGPTFAINVTIFVDMDMEDQALLFATINLKQTPVDKSLVYDLYEFARTRSPQKTCHNIARLLNYKDDSPFHRRIMILGRASGEKSETLTQAGFIKPLIEYISRDAMTDRDRLKRGLQLDLVDAGYIRTNKTIFRNLFVEDRDAEIARIIWNYFLAVQQRWPSAWTENRRGSILNRTTGYMALMRFLPLAYLTLGIDSVVPTAEFKGIFDRVKLSDDDFTNENFIPGSSGQGALFRKLQADTKIDEKAVWKGLLSLPNV